jgi:hypothetical protein
MLSLLNSFLCIYTPREYNATILNTEPVGEEILMVVARDSDSGSYGSVTYRLRSGNSEGLFAINSRTGLITVAGSLAASRGKGYVSNGTFLKGQSLIQIINSAMKLFAALTVQR